MIGPPACLHVSRNVRFDTLPFRGNPVDDGTLHPLRVVGPGPVGTFLDLEICYFAMNSQWYKESLTNSAMSMMSVSELSMRRV